MRANELAPSIRGVQSIEEVPRKDLETSKKQQRRMIRATMTGKQHGISISRSEEELDRRSRLSDDPGPGYPPNPSSSSFSWDGLWQENDKAFMWPGGVG